MADWYFISYEKFQLDPQPTHEGTSPLTGWWKGTNHTDSGSVVPASLQSGDTLWVLDDHNNSTIDGLLQLSNIHGITIRGDYPSRPGTLYVTSIGGESTNCTYKNLSCNNSFGLGSSSNTIIDGVDVVSANKGFFVNSQEDVDYVTIRNSSFSGNNEGIEIFTKVGVSRTGWIIEDNTIYDVGRNPAETSKDYEGIGIQRLRNSIIRNNHIYNCRYGINMWESGSDTIQDLEIYGNVIHDINLGTSGWPSRGIMFSGGAHADYALKNISIHDNIIYNIGREGIRLQEPDIPTGLYVYNNIVANVNTEYGTPHTDVVNNLAGWDIYSNIYQYSYQSNIYEIIISASDYGVMSEGDIIDVRKPRGYLGKEEQKLFLTLLIESDLDISDLKKHNYNGNKFGTYIVLEELNDSPYFLNLDLDQVRNANIAYQPSLGIDVTNGVFRSIPTTINMDAMIYTK